MSETRKLAGSLDVDLVCNGRLTGADEERKRARLCGAARRSRRPRIDPAPASISSAVVERGECELMDDTVDIAAPNRVFASRPAAGRKKQHAPFVHLGENNSKAMESQFRALSCGRPRTLGNAAFVVLPTATSAAAILVADTVTSIDRAAAVLCAGVVLRRRGAPARPLQRHRRNAIMTNVAEAPTRVGIRQTLARWYRDLQTIHSPILRYGLSVVCVGIGIGLALAAHRREIHDVELPILVLSIALIAWYAGAGPSVLAVMLAAICLDYFWAERGEDFFSAEGLTNLFTFVTMAIIVSLFSIVRRRVEENLREARDGLRIEVEQRARREDEIRNLNQELAKTGC